MNRLFTILFVTVLLVGGAFAQSKPQPKPMTAKPATPPGPRIPPPQYVLKKDYEPKIQELEGKIRSAVNAGSDARHSVGEVADSLNQISMKVQDIENLLNSANFKIALNSDSLKLTQSKIDELRGDMEKNLLAAETRIDSAMMLIYILFGLCIILPVIVYVMMVSLNKKTHEEIRNNVERMNGDIQKNYISQQDEIKKIKSGLDSDVYSAKTDLNSQLNREKDANSAQFRKITQLLDLKMDKPAEEQGQPE